MMTLSSFLHRPNDFMRTATSGVVEYMLGLPTLA
jgi:hypothetical protein